MILPAALWFMGVAPSLFRPLGNFVGWLLSPGFLLSVTLPNTLTNYLEIAIVGLSWVFWSLYLALGALPFVYIVRRGRQAQHP